MAHGGGKKKKRRRPFSTFRTEKEKGGAIGFQSQDDGGERGKKGFVNEMSRKGKKREKREHYLFFCCLLRGDIGLAVTRGERKEGSRWGVCPGGGRKEGEKKRGKTTHAADFATSLVEKKTLGGFCCYWGGGGFFFRR